MNYDAYRDMYKNMKPRTTPLDVNPTDLLTHGFRYGTCFKIKDVIFNPPATVILWKDGTKTVVKAADGDDFDPEKGMAMAVSKKVFGNAYHKLFKDYVEPYYEDAIDSDECLENENRLMRVNYNIDFYDRNVAENVKRQIECLFRTYGCVSVADVYEAANLTSEYADTKRGWLNQKQIDSMLIYENGPYWTLSIDQPIEFYRR